MEESSALKVLTGKFTRKRHLLKPGCRWEDNMREIGVNTRTWVDSAHKGYEYRIEHPTVIFYLT